MHAATTTALRLGMPFALLVMSACVGTNTTVSTPAPAPTIAPAPTQPAAQPTSAPPTAAVAPTSAPATAAPAAAPTTAAKPAAGAGVVVLSLAPEGNEARFRAREQLARNPLPNDAVGTTKDVTGTIAVGPNGLVPEGSKITVNMDALATDQAMRDRFIKTTTLQTQQFRDAEFSPKEARGLSTPLPTSGEHSFELLGDMTIHGVTRPATWAVTATFTPSEVNGLGTTSITLPDYGMEKPSVPVVLSIEDEIRLEMAFKALR